METIALAHLVAWLGLIGLVALTSSSIHDKLDAILRELRKGK